MNEPGLTIILWGSVVFLFACLMIANLLWPEWVALVLAISAVLLICRTRMNERKMKND